MTSFTLDPPAPSLEQNSSVPLSHEAAGNGLWVVGVGASAGGLSALEAFFSAVPDMGQLSVAFVVLQHLSLEYKTMLASFIQKHTRLNVVEVDQPTVVCPDSIYVLLPSHSVYFSDGSLCFVENSERSGQLPIDFLFGSLAKELGPDAAGVILSGTGRDGSEGVQAISAAGGLVVVQTPDSASHDGMPKSALATGVVAQSLPPGSIMNYLLSYRTSQQKTPVMVDPFSGSEATVERIFDLLRSQTGHDFSQYKISTIQRRIDRRMKMHQIEHLNDYVSRMQQSSVEVEALFKDILIGVTSFFRDAPAFDSLAASVLTPWSAKRAATQGIRVWVPGCSTGEEPYSLAILFREWMDSLKQLWPVQVFATDIDNRAVAVARAGVYPSSISADVSPERLNRYFTVQPDGKSYRIAKVIRDMVVFSEQDVIKDPPFSKLDLISCRNLLIYLGSALQKRIIPLFHYALLPGGHLLLGTSESIGDFGDLFSVLDRKYKIYQKKNDSLGKSTSSPLRVLPSVTTRDSLPPSPSKPGASLKLPLRQLTEQALLQQVPLVAVLVDRHGDIFYVHGRTGMYLEPSPGEAGVNNVIRMAREGLRHELAMALQKAGTTHDVIRANGLRVKTNGHYTLVNLTVRPVSTGGAATGSEALLFAVILEDKSEVATGATQDTDLLHDVTTVESTDSEVNLGLLRQQLRAKEEFLHAANEQLATSNEELKSSNEEMQSINEELQSANEELETSKEELQSVNEELATVNTELQTKVADLSRVNNDMNNLMAGTGIATLFLDTSLRILRFTPATTRIINLIPGDTGRPLAHVVSNLVGYSQLVDDAQSVLDTLIPKEVEVHTNDARCYTMRIQPYRTLDNVIEGAVVSFLDITQIKRTQKAALESDIRFKALFEQSPVAMAFHELIRDVTGTVRDYRTTDANARYNGLFPIGSQKELPPISQDPRRVLIDWSMVFSQVLSSGTPQLHSVSVGGAGQRVECVVYQSGRDTMVTALFDLLAGASTNTGDQATNGRLFEQLTIVTKQDVPDNPPAEKVGDP